MSDAPLSNEPLSNEPLSNEPLSNEPLSHGPVEKDPEDWVTGDEPMTAPQESYLRTLAREAGQDVPDGLSKAAASELIDKLQGQSERLKQR